MPRLLNTASQGLHTAALLRLLLGILLPLLIVGALAEDVLEPQRRSLETPLLLWIHAHSSAALDQLSLTLATVGGFLVIAPLSALIAALLWWRARQAAPFFVVAVLGAALLNGVMKVAFHRPRPELWPRLVSESGASFPSGHAMYSVAFILALSLLMWRTPWRWPVLIVGVVFTLMVGVSRLVLGVHYPTDVLAGWLSGTAWVLGTYTVLHPFGASIWKMKRAA